MIYTRNGEGYVHENIEASVKALQEICNEINVETEVSDNPESFSGGNLSRFNAVIFSNTNNEALGVRGAVKTLKNLYVGKVGYFGLNDNGDVSGQSPVGKAIDGVFIVNSMQSGGTYSHNAATAKTIDTWDKNVYTSAKYIVQVVQAGNIHTEELMVIQDGTDVYISEYGIVTNNGQLGTFDGSISGGNVLITFTPSSATACTINVVRQSVLTGTENWC